MDIGFGYDSEDSFVDDSEAVHIIYVCNSVYLRHVTTLLMMRGQRLLIFVRKLLELFL